MGRLTAYNSYKKTGIEWVSEIPQHWEVKRAKRIFAELSIKGFPNEPLLAATQTKGVVLKSKYENRTVVAQNNLETLKLVEPGNFVISLRSFQGGIELAHDRGIISPAYTVLKLKVGNKKEFFKYFLKSKEYINSLTLLVTGIREGQNIDTNKFKESLLFVSVAVRVVLDVSDLSVDAVLVVTTEVDDAVLALVATADVASGDAALVVTATRLRERAEQRLLRGRTGDFSEISNARATTTRGRRLVLANSHVVSSSPFYSPAVKMSMEPDFRVTMARLVSLRFPQPVRVRRRLP